MPRIPSTESVSRAKAHRSKIQDILRKDAERQIAQGDLDPSSERLVKWLLSQENMMAASWTPSLDARRKIAHLPQQEDQLVQDGLVYWLADEVRNLIISSRGYEAFKLLEKFDLTIIEKLEPSLRREKYLFYCIGDSWFVRFKDGSKYEDKWALFKDEKWIRCIAFLLEHPYRDFSPRDVLDGQHTEKETSDSLPTADKKTIEAAFKKVYEDEGFDEENLKWRTIVQTYKKMVRVSEIKGQLNFRWLFNPDSDRANVGGYIKDGKTKIKKSLPHLWEHLNKYVKAGNSPRYIPPENTPRWYIHW
jgi:hypothetical protein